MAATARLRPGLRFEANMSLSVSGYGQQALVYQMMQPLAVNANSGASARTPSAPSPTASPAATSASHPSRVFAVTDMLAVFLSGLVSGGPLPSDPAQNPMSPAMADSSSATAAAAPISAAAADSRQAQTELQTFASERSRWTSSAAPASAAPYGPSATSGSSTSDLGIVLAAYVSNMESASADADAGHAPVSASAAAVSHPGSHAHSRDHASSPAAVSSARHSAAAA
jgi:hypothetical protein